MNVFCVNEFEVGVNDSIFSGNEMSVLIAVNSCNKCVDAVYCNALNVIRCRSYFRIVSIGSYYSV